MTSDAMETTPTIDSLTHHKGIAGQFSITAVVTYPYEAPESVTFVGSIYGGPVVMQTPANPSGTFVVDPSRFGVFSESWVRQFFAATNV